MFQQLVQRLQSEQRNAPAGGQGGRGRKQQQQGASAMAGEDGWTSVRTNRIDPEKMRLTNPHHIDESTLQVSFGVD